MPLLRLLIARRWLWVGLLLGVLVLLLPRPEGLSPEGQRTLALLATVIVFLVTEPIPLPATALLIAFGQALLSLGTPNEIARSYMSDAVFFIMGSLMISVALVKQKFDVRIAFALLRLTGPNAYRVAFGLAATSALLASFIGEHTVAAMMLPVALGIVGAVEHDRPKTRQLAALLLLSIVYGCTVAALGTPSGGARNAIMIDFWRRMFGIRVDYLRWMLYAYPMVLLQLPFVPLVLRSVFRPEVVDLRRALVRLRRRVRETGRLSRRDWGALGIFVVVLASWILLSGRFGLGMVALFGASLYLITGHVRWADLNSGVNWGVVLLYAAAVSLGYQLETSGAATWLAEVFLALLGGIAGLGLLLAIALLMTLLTNTMSSGAAVAVLGPVTLQMATLSGTSPLSVGFVTALASAFSYLTVFAAPAGMIAYGSGRLRPSDFARAGARLLVASVIILLLLAQFYWPLLGL